MKDSQSYHLNGRAVGIFAADIAVDNLVCGLPDGVISLMGGAWSDGFEFHPIVDLKACLNGEKLEAIMRLDMAEDLLESLTAAIEMAKASVGVADEQIEHKE